MKLENYNRLTFEQLLRQSTEFKELVNGIYDFLNHFYDAVKADRQREDKAFYLDVKEFLHTRLFLEENKQKRMALARFLGDYPQLARHVLKATENPEQKLIPQIFDAFAYVMLKFRLPFGEQRGKLLELSGNPRWALFGVVCEDVCDYILDHYEYYNDRETLKNICSELKRFKRRLSGQDSYWFDNSEYAVLLKRCKHQLFWRKCK